jgi:uncharacterized protein (TIGR02246 family)
MPDVAKMDRHPLELLIQKADSAINREDFDTLLELYTDDAVLVIKPGMNAVGKAQIRKAFEAIASHFKHAVDVKQAGMKILESEDTALVLTKTIVTPPQGQPIKRDATYVFRRTANGDWLCAIDNSYGHELFLHEDMVNDGARPK